MNKLRFTALFFVVIMSLAGMAEARCGQGYGNGNGNGRGRCNQGGQKQKNPNRENNCRLTLDDLPLENLNDFEKASLALMREEEKLARDVYQALGEMHDLRPFINIPRSEQRHMDQLGALLERYDLEDPLSGKQSGQFENATLQELHDRLVEQGSQSEIAALQVGAAIEDLDIHDLQTALSGGDKGKIDNQDITMVYNNLIKGSRNHMRAFVRNLERRGASYEAQHISAEELESILSDGRDGGAARGKKFAGKGGGRNHERAACRTTRGCCR
jgi:hypothetical protein